MSILKSYEEKVKFRKGLEGPEYYVETWMNGNKSHVIDTLLTCRSNVDFYHDYIAIMASFEEYDKRLCLKISILVSERYN